MKIEIEFAREEIFRMLHRLTDHNINYSIIRSLPDEIINDDDIDLLVDQSDDQKLQKLFMDEGYILHRNRRNRTDYFFKKPSINKLIKFHIQHQIFYFNRKSNAAYTLIGFAENILKKSIIKNRIRLANDRDNEILLISKIAYEGKKVSIKYEKMFSIFGTSEYNDRTKLNTIIENYINENKIKIVETKLNTNSRTSKLIRRFVIIVRNIFFCNSISLFGIDGAGKSEAAVSLCNSLGRRATIQYMGQKKWETRIAKFMFDKPRGKKRMVKLFKVLALYYESWFRYLKNIARDRIVIYDRGPEEYYLSQNNKCMKMLFYIIFYLLFPKSKYRFYLYCDINTSLMRKSDINSEEEKQKLKNRKLIFDNHFIRNNKYVKINTDEMNKEKVVQEIINRLSIEYMLRL